MALFPREQITWDFSACRITANAQFRKTGETIRLMNCKLQIQVVEREKTLVLFTREQVTWDFSACRVRANAQFHNTDETIRLKKCKVQSPSCRKRENPGFVST